MKIKDKSQLKESQIKTLNNIFQTCLLMQVALHKMEDCPSNVIFVRENKQRLTNYLKWLESIVETLTMQLNLDESEEYVKLIATIEENISTIKLEF